MPAGLWNIEWLNANSQRRYPLTENSLALAQGQGLALPNSFLVELDLPIHAGLNANPSQFYIKHVGVYATGFTIVVGYQSSTGAPIDVATALIPRDSFVPNTVYALVGINDFADSVGKVVIGSLDEFNNQAAGFFTFYHGNSRLEPDCIRPIIRGVSALVVVSGGDRSERLYGDIELVAEDNVQLVPVVVSGGVTQIRISAINGEGLNEDCICDGDDEAVPIRRINGIPPTSAGDFTLLGNTCLQIDAITNGLQLKDVCSEPCCGCAELEAISRDLESFVGKATTLENFLVRLESSVTQMDQVVLGSRLNDRGCISCD